MTWDGVVDRSQLPGFDSIETRVEGMVGVITMNEPERLNPTGLNHMHIHFQLLEWRADHDIRVVVLTGKGRAFCAGADVRPKHTGGHDGQGWTQGQRLAYSYAYGSFWETIRDYPKPIIAAVNGYAIGGGWEMAEVCDLVIASEQAIFAAGEINVGTMPFGTGLPYLTKILGKHRALQLAMTGMRVSAQQALAWGLVNDVVPHDELMNRTMELANQIAAQPPVTINAIRQVVHETFGQFDNYKLERALAYFLSSLEDTKAAKSAWANKEPRPEFHAR